MAQTTLMAATARRCLTASLLHVLTAAITDTWLRTAMQALYRKHNRHKESLEDWEEHHEWLKGKQKGKAVR